MGLREFVVRRGEQILHREHATVILDEASTWKRIQELADQFHAPRVRVIVRNEAGAIIISVGVATLQAVGKAA